MGRPRGKVKPAEALVTRRVRHLIDLAHGGNVHEASKISGVPSATLRGLYSGRIVNPEVRTLEALGLRYHVNPGWFIDPREPEAVPSSGYTFRVRVRSKDGELVERPIMIQWTSWPLPDVFRRLFRHLTGLPPAPDRPIIGDLPFDDEHLSEIGMRVIEYLLAPILSVESDFNLGALVDGYRNDETETRRLRQLGVFWEDVLAPVLDEER